MTKWELLVALIPFGVAFVGCAVNFAKVCARVTALEYLTVEHGRQLTEMGFRLEDVRDLAHGLEQRVKELESDEAFVARVRRGISLGGVEP